LDPNRAFAVSAGARAEVLLSVLIFRLRQIIPQLPGIIHGVMWSGRCRYSLMADAVVIGFFFTNQATLHAVESANQPA